MVGFCCEIFLLCAAALMLTFFIAGLLFICASSTSITWERTLHPVRRPAFSLENTLLRRFGVEVSLNAQDFPGASPGIALDRLRGVGRSSCRRGRCRRSAFVEGDSQSPECYGQRR